MEKIGHLMLYDNHMLKPTSKRQSYIFDERYTAISINSLTLAFYIN